MKQQERIEDREEALRIMLDGFRATIFTALPCIVESFDPGTQNCSLQPTIQGIQYFPDGSTELKNFPLLVDVPVYRFRGGGFALTVPIVPGDEGLVIFASRAIDSWWQNGGVQPPVEIRPHQLSDGFFLPGFNSQPKNLAAFAVDAIELRNDAGDVKVSVKAGEIDLVNGSANIKMTSAEIDINAPTIKLNGIVWDTHEHPGVQAGGSKTGAPTAP